MRKLFYLVVSIVIFGLIISGCIFHVVPPLGQDGSIDIVKNDVFFEIDLIAGQHTIAGSITVSNDDGNLFVTYETVDNWLINETHLYIGTTIPTNSAPGKFPYKHEELGGVTADTYEIPLEDLGVGPCDIVYIAAHAELVKGAIKETGWAEGIEIKPGKNWAMYFEYQLSWDEFTDYEKIAITTDKAIHAFVTNCEIYGEEQAKQMIIDTLLGKEGVIDAGIGIDNESIWFQWENGIISSFSEYPELDDKQNSLSRSFNEKEILMNSKDIRNTPENNNAILFDWEISWQGTWGNKIIQNELDAYKYDAKFCTKSEFTLYELENINDYGVIYINSHGMGDDKYGIKILTGQEASVETGEVWQYFRKKYGDEEYGSMIGTHTFYKKINGIDVPMETYFCFYPNFVQKIALYENFPKSLVYANTCYGLANTSMADAFINRGAYAYCGYTSKSYAENDMDMSVFHSLLYGGWDLFEAISFAIPTPPATWGKVHFYPEDGPKYGGDLYLVGGGQEKFPEIGAWTITGYDPYCIQIFGVESIPDRSIVVHWPTVAGAEEYRVYRSINWNSNFNLVYSGDGMTGEIDVDNRIVWYDFDTTPGNSYSYKVSCVVNGQENIPSDVVTRSVWLPECSLASPPNYNPEDPYDQPVTEPDPLLEWNPVGVSGYPYQGDIQSGKSQIWVVAYDTNYPEPDQGEQIWEESFNNLTTSSTRFDPDVAREPLVPGSDHIYAWETKGIGYDYNEDIIAMSWSGARHFFYILGSTDPVHNLTQGTYYTTIQAALDDANSEDTIEVDDGTYDESIIFLSGKKIILQSINGASLTTICGNADSSTVNLVNSLNGTTLKGFTITHKSGNNGRGIYIDNSNININNCTISGNSADWGSGIGICNSSTLIITGSTISGNSADSGGGIYNYTGSTLTIYESTISDNSVSDCGGGIANCDNSTLTIYGSAISGNSTYIHGGGGIFNYAYSTLTITGSTISGNSAGDDGGGISNCDNSTLTITGSTISGNSAEYNGGGIYIGPNSGTLSIGGSNENDLSKFNEFTDNYKTGNAPSPDQHICNSTGDCHMDYPYNDYYPDNANDIIDGQITDISPLTDPFDLDAWYTTNVYVKNTGNISHTFKVRGLKPSGTDFQDGTEKFLTIDPGATKSVPFTYQFYGTETCRSLTFYLYDNSGNLLDTKQTGTLCPVTLDAVITNIRDIVAGPLIDPFELNKWYTAVVHISVDYNGPDSGIIEVKPKLDSGIEYDPIVKEFPYDKNTLGGTRGFDYKFIGAGTTRELTFELYDQATGIKLDEYTSETLHLMQPDPNLDYIESIPSSTTLEYLHLIFFGNAYFIRAHFDDGHTEDWTDFSKFLFESSDDYIVNVDEETGAMVGTGEGTATITITYKEDTSKKAYLSVTVY
jgi:hypothetical protein